MSDELDDYNVCYECMSGEDNYYTDDNGDMQCACDDCPFNGRDMWEE